MEPVQEIQSLVKKGVRRLNRFFYVGVVVGTVMGPCVLIAALIPALRQYMPGGEDVRGMMIFGGMMTLLFGIALVEQVFKYGKDQALVWGLRRSPRDIVWAYKEISEGRVQHRAGARGATVARYVHVCFHMANGKKVRVWLSEREADRLLELLETTFPHLSTGYSKELEAAYKQEPTSLRSNPRRVEGVKRVAGGVRMG
jgi:hypothetical protein